MITNAFRPNHLRGGSSIRILGDMTQSTDMNAQKVTPISARQWVIMLAAPALLVLAVVVGVAVMPERPSCSEISAELQTIKERNRDRVPDEWETGDWERLQELNREVTDRQNLGEDCAISSSL